jgi:unsaturated chondroitin disaccharide hydrolase
MKKKIPFNEWEKNFYELALKITGAVQASRWMSLPNNLGYITSFNGKHSLFSDTIRSCRALAVSHQLGHVLMSEQDEKINLLKRLLQHAETTARFNVYFGKNRDAYDVSGRVVHESIFNTANGVYRCASSQQGYSPFTTWTRGHAWILAGYPEQIEFLETLPEKEFANILPGIFKNKKQVIDRFLEVADATAEFYIRETPTDGIPYWDTGAPGLSKLGKYLDRAADPYNKEEPVDSSAAAIAAQGLIRLGLYYNKKKQSAKGSRYLNAGLTVAKSLMQEPYLSLDPNHQGLLLHSVYHRPNGWDYIPKGQKVPNGEACMWGDYHLMELALLIARMSNEETYYQFFVPEKKS